MVDSENNLSSQWTGHTGAGLPVSRRRFVARAAASLITGGVLLSGCRRGDAPRTAGEQPLPSEPRDRHPLLPDREPIVRVRVRVLRETAEPLRLGSDGQWIRLVQPHLSPQGLALLGPLTLLAGDGGWQAIDAKGYTTPIIAFESLHFMPLAPDQIGHGLRLDEEHYPGSLRIVNQSDEGGRRYDIVNHVALERYLPGVLARELYNHWHDETHAAQAVAARSFACAEYAWFRTRRHFDMTNTQASQVYAGSVTHARSIEAVEQTRGLVIAHGNRLVPGYYSSCCGGLAARAIDAIGPNPINDIPPLHGRSGMDVCTEAPAASWKVERQRAVLTRRMMVYGEAHNISPLRALATVRAVDVSAVNTHGRPTQYVITDERGREAQINAETFRHAANFAGRGLARPRQTLRSSHFEATASGNTLAFDGHGFGHGVGMCQYGAQFQASEGRMHDAILKWYYPDARIAKAYG